MEFLDARRLTGSNLLWDRASSILDIGCSAEEAEALIHCWQAVIRKILVDVDWATEETTFKRLSGGVSLAVSAPIDGLYAATAMNQLAWECCDAELGGGQAPDYVARLTAIRDEILEESNKNLLAIEKRAQEEGVTFLWDDDEVSLGLGVGSETWVMANLPMVAEISWGKYRDIPVGIVTGTNGKTTTVRLTHHILQTANLNVGISSTEWIAVNDRIIDRGDWSGPGGARQVLRQTDADVAILETARGGLLRRGLGVKQADVALITNLTEDHLGDFGSQNLQELLDIKWMVSSTVSNNGHLILNADDPLLVAKAKGYAGEIIWFSLNSDNAIVIAHLAAGGLVYCLDYGELVRVQGEQREVICAACDIPITMGGAAKHNTANALGAAALAACLGRSLLEIRMGLTSMTQDDNPGRSNVYNINGITVLIDFAHNPAAMQALFDMAQAVPAKRRLLAFGQAGDRPDPLIRELAESGWKIGLDAVVVSELEQYHRGRERGEVYGVIRDELLKLGVLSEQIMHFDEELQSLQAALDWAEEGDLIIMLALGGSAPIQEKLLSVAGQS